MNKFLLTAAIVGVSLICNAQYFNSINGGSTIATDPAESAGTAWVDYDGDGDLDLYTCNAGSNNFLYQNDGGGIFTRILTGPLVNDGSNTLTSCWADYDNDGDLDAFLAINGSNNKLYRNDGGGSFTEILTGDIVSNGGASNGASWGDYDNDGYVDLVVGNYSGQNNFLYHNNGNGTFTRILTGPIVTDGGNSWTPTWADYDNDGFIDLFITNGQSENNFLYHNNNGTSFTKITVGDIVNDGGASYGFCLGDYDNDGDLDAFLSNYQAQANQLYQNNGNGTFTKVLTGNIVTTTGYTAGCQWMDINNDGHLDLAVSHAHFSGGPISENIIYLNNGNGTFTEITSGEAYVEHDLSSLGLAAGDYDNDGFLDLSAAANQGDLNALYRNNTTANNWVNLLLEGTVSNRAAIGAKIQLKANIAGNDVWQFHQVQSTNGTLAQGSLNVEFGLGDASVIDSIIVTWPSGIVCYYTNVAANAFYDILETCAPLGCVDPLSGFTFTDNLLNVTFTDTSVITGTGTYFWDFGDGDFSSLTNPSHNYTSPGTYTVCLIVTDSCGADTICDIVTVSNCLDPTADFNYSINQLDVTFTDNSAAAGTTTYWWDFGDGNFSSQTNPINTYATSGTYWVCLTVTDTCGTDSTCTTINICIDPIADFNFTDNGNGNVTFNDVSTITNGASYWWDFGDGNFSSLANTSNTYTLSGTYIVCLTVTDSCGTDSTCTTIDICASPVADFTTTDNGVGNITFNDSSIATGAATHFWDFGDGNFSSQTNPSYTYSASGIYTVCLTITDSCGADTICTDVIVDLCVDPIAGFTFTDNGNGNVLFSDTSTTSGGNTYWWDFGDGNFSSLANPDNDFLANGTYTICLTITDSCGSDTICQNITISGLGVNDHYNNLNVTVFPNPCSDYTVIQIENGEGNYTVELYDIAGRLITVQQFLSTNALTIDRKNLEAGTYLFRIVQNNSTVSTGKLMVVD